MLKVVGGVISAMGNQSTGRKENDMRKDTVILLIDSFIWIFALGVWVGTMIH